MEIRVYTQYGTDQNRRQYAVCSAYIANGYEDGAHLWDTDRYHVRPDGIIQGAARTARDAALARLQPRILSSLAEPLKIEFVEMQDADA